MLEQVITWIVHTVNQWGYPGIVGLMFLESSFFPFPSEIVIAPAGYLAYRGDMSLWLVLVSGIGGSLLGAIFNYWLAVRYGRPFFEKYGRYFLVSKKALQKADVFFAQHGHISTFIGRLLPGIRQYISLPAGLTRMNFFLFCLFTTLGASIWVTVLGLAGFWFGRNQELLKGHINKISIGLAILCLCLAAAYIWRFRRNRSRLTSPRGPQRQ
ncbi:MAG: DedA family protein [Desulfatiglandaceae bacterium]|jgi:membrane protein DedA with SNARE-associated domain